MMIMAEGRKISYHTLNNFRSSEHANKLIKTCFIYFANLRADANRYTFVWRKAEEKYHARLKEDAVKLYEELIKKEIVKGMAKEEVQTSTGLE